MFNKHIRMADKNYLTHPASELLLYLSRTTESLTRMAEHATSKLVALTFEQTEPLTRMAEHISRM